jgi:outer membrane biosynthesis protein TonB
MIHWSGTLPAECQPKLSQTNSSSSKKAEPLRDRSQEEKQIAGSEHSPSPKPSPTPKPKIPDESPPPQQAEKPNPIEDVIKIAKDHPDLTGGVIAIGVAGTVAVVASAPLILAAGIGAAVWFAIRTVL